MKKAKKSGLMLSLFLGLAMSIWAAEILDPGSRSVQDGEKTSLCQDYHGVSTALLEDLRPGAGK
jgi:hypothetical protein